MNRPAIVASESSTPRQPAPRPITVGFLVHTFDVGGQERCVTRLINHLDPKRFRSVVISLGPVGGAVDWIEVPHVPVLSLGHTGGNNPRLAWRLARLLRAQQIDILHSHNWGTLLEAVTARRLAAVPAHVHAERGTVLGTLDQRGWKFWVRARLMRLALGRADAVVSVAEAVRDKVSRYCGFPAARIELIENGVDAPPCSDAAVARATIRARLGLTADSVLLGSVGRLVCVKDFGAAIEAVRRVVAQQQIDLHLLLVGDGPEEQRLAEAARAAQVAPRIHLVGRQSNVGDWLSAMDLYINCSLSEGQSQSVLEAMSRGLPSVVTDVGDNARLMGHSDACGLAVPSGDPLALARAVGRLAADPQERNLLAHRALNRYQNCYSIGRMIQIYEALYTRLIQQRGSLPTSSPALPHAAESFPATGAGPP